MKLAVSLLLNALLLPMGLLAAEIPSAAEQIALAVLAAPEEWRDGAAVWGFGQNGEVANLRQGTNHLACFADDPTREKIMASCVSKDLEEWQVRLYELQAQGSSGVVKTLWEEVHSGKLKEPPPAWVVNFVKGNSFNGSSGKVADYERSWIVVVPNMTPETLGLSGEKSEDKPWLMFPGTPGAHIMIPAVTEQP